MAIINDIELNQIYGGSKVVVGGIIIGIITFIIGLIDGYMRPLSCNE